MTQPISTYQIDFFISKFNSKEQISNNFTQVRLFTHSENDNRTQLGMEATINILKIFENEFLFELSCSLVKLDQIALPNFRHCSNVGQGIVFYSVNCLLYESNVSYFKIK